MRAEYKYLSVVEELNELPAALGPVSSNQCLDRLLLSLIDHSNICMRKRAADVIEWLTRVSEISPQMLVNHISQNAFCEGREIAIGILHRLVLHAPSRIEQIVACDGFERLTRTNNFLVRFLIEEMGRTWERSAAIPAAVSSSQTALFEWSFDAASLLDLQEGSCAMAVRSVAELCAPLSPAEIRELIDIRLRAFAAPHPFQGYGFEREAIFRALANVSDASARRAVVSASRSRGSRSDP